MAFHLQDEERSQLQALCRKYAVRRLKLFGSAVTDDFDTTRSDLDLLVDFAEPPTAMRLSTQFFGFLEELELLFGRKVDLLEESAIENSRMRRQAQANSVTLYAA